MIIFKVLVIFLLIVLIFGSFPTDSSSSTWSPQTGGSRSGRVIEKKIAQPGKAGARAPPPADPRDYLVRTVRPNILLPKEYTRIAQDQSDIHIHKQEVPGRIFAWHDDPIDNQFLDANEKIGNQYSRGVTRDFALLGKALRRAI